MSFEDRLGLSSNGQNCLETFFIHFPNSISLLLYSKTNVMGLQQCDSQCESFLYLIFQYDLLFGVNRTAALGMICKSAEKCNDEDFCSQRNFTKRTDTDVKPLRPEYISKILQWNLIQNDTLLNFLDTKPLCWWGDQM